jgi:hypothetical protein
VCHDAFGYQTANVDGTPFVAQHPAIRPTTRAHLLSRLVCVLFVLCLVVQSQDPWPRYVYRASSPQRAQHQHKHHKHHEQEEAKRSSTPLRPISAVPGGDIGHFAAYTPVPVVPPLAIPGSAQKEGSGNNSASPRRRRSRSRSRSGKGPSPKKFAFGVTPATPRAGASAEGKNDGSVLDRKHTPQRRRRGPAPPSDKTSSSSSSSSSDDEAAVAARAIAQPALPVTAHSHATPAPRVLLVHHLLHDRLGIQQLRAHHPTQCTDGKVDVRGVLVQRVVSGSPAFLGGLREGDVITHVQQRAVRSPEELIGALKRVCQTQRVPFSLRWISFVNRRAPCLLPPSGLPGQSSTRSR